MDAKVIAVTGAASGIGYALAKLLATRGARVSMSDVSIDGLEKARTTITKSVPTISSTDIMTAACDVRDIKQVHAWLQKTVDTFGRLDGAANIAGVISKYHGMEEGVLVNQDESEWDFVLSVNLTGVMHCLQEELNFIQPSGSIVNASSIASMRGFRGNAAYSVSKAGVNALTRTAAKEHGTDNGAKHVRVNAVAPGLIETPMLAAASSKHQGEGGGSDGLDAEVARVPIARKADPAEVAKVIAFLLSDDSSFVTGSIYMVDGGWKL